MSGISPFAPGKLHRRLHERRDTGTLGVPGDGWKPQHIRPQACGHAYQIEQEPVAHLDWAAMQPHGQLRFYLGGSIEVDVAGRRITLTGGDLLSLPLPVRDVRLRIRQLPLEYLWIQVTGEPATQLVADVVAELGLVQHLSVKGPTCRKLRSFVAKVQRAESADPFVWSSVTYDLLMTWWQEGCEAAETSRRAAGLTGDGSNRSPLPLAKATGTSLPTSSRVLDAPPKTVQEMADRLGYSRSHLSAVVSRTWHESPGQVLRRDRLQRAAEMLQRGETVKAAAAACGYASHQAFSRAYSKHFGHLPSVERRTR
jgi:AraC-like DNA-binding protein